MPEIDLESDAETSVRKGACSCKREAVLLNGRIVLQDFGTAKVCLSFCHGSSHGVINLIGCRNWVSITEGICSNLGVDLVAKFSLQKG